MMNAANTDGIRCFWWGCVVCSLFRRIFLCSGGFVIRRC